MGGTILDEKQGYKSAKPLVSFVPPSAGMFVWLAVHLDSHKDFQKIKARGEDPNRVLLEKLWTKLAENKVSDCELASSGRIQLNILLCVGIGPGRSRVLF